MATKSKLRAQQGDVDNIFAMDEAKEQNGINLNYGKLIVSVARAGGSNTAFAKVWEEETRPFRRMLEGGIDLPEDVAEGIAHTCYSQAIVKGWNMYEGETEVPCTPDNIVAQFKRNPEFFRFVYQESQKLANYRKATLAGEAKN